MYLVDLLQKQKKITDEAIQEKDKALEENKKLVAELSKKNETKFLEIKVQE